MNRLSLLSVKRAAALLVALTVALSCTLSVGAEGAAVSGGLDSAYKARQDQKTTTATTDGTGSTTAQTPTTPAAADETTTTTAPLDSNENNVLDAEQVAVSLNADGTPNITAGGAVVMDCDTGMVLYGLNENKQLPMASTTKIMTCILALESGDIGRTVTVTEECMEMLDGTQVGLKVGNKITMYDLCVAMMMYSGNDAANTAAVAVGGTIGGFVSLMNQKAAELGMLNTHFDTPSGLDQFSDGAHYSSAYDMALLGRYAMKNPDFRTIVSYWAHDIYFDPYPRGYTLYTHNYLLEGRKFGYVGCDGIKTGVTSRAGQCLVSHVTSDQGLSLVCVTLNNVNRWNDHKALYDYAKSLYEQAPVDPDISAFDATIVGGKSHTVAVTCHPDETYNVLKSQKPNVKREIVYDRFIYAPVRQGDVVGSLQYTADGIVLASWPIAAAEDVEASTNGWFSDYMQAIAQRTKKK